MLNVNVSALSTELEKLTDEICRLNKNLENLNLDPVTIREAVEIARDLRTMLAGALGYRIEKSSLQLSRPRASVK